MVRQRIEVLGTSLEIVHVPSPPTEPTLVFLHEALGSVALWRDFPEQLAAATGLGWMAYSRRGHGSSAPLDGPRGIDYLDFEAIDVLPAVLEALGISRPLLFGHSDGATLALIYAASTPDPIEGLILEAPHVFVEDVTLAGIRETMERAEATDLKQRLGRYHDHVDQIFEAWHSVWLDPGYRNWNIGHRLPANVAPILQIQGSDDRYGTLRQLEAIASGSGGSVETVVFEGVGHIPHVEAPARVIEVTQAFIAKLLQDRSSP
jgi:pimeloyl-ACP methyl ester carboxylesterase